MCNVPPILLSSHHSPFVHLPRNCCPVVSPMSVHTRLSSSHRRPPLSSHQFPICRNASVERKSRSSMRKGGRGCWDLMSAVRHRRSRVIADLSFSITLCRRDASSVAFWHLKSLVLLAPPHFTCPMSSYALCRSWAKARRQPCLAVVIVVISWLTLFDFSSNWSRCGQRVEVDPCP